MHLGRSKPKPVDLSKALWDSDAFSPRPIKRLGLNGDITAMAVEPLTGMLAFGTDRGSVHLYGAPSVTAEVAVSSAPNARIRFIAFAQSCSQMAVIDSRNFVTVYDLASPRRPTVSSSFELNQRAMALTTSPSHSHAFIALADGQCLVYDLERGQPSPYAIPNLWEAEEIKEGHYRSRQSAPNPALVDVLIHPRNLNSLLLVYDAGVIVWDIADRKAARIFRGVVPLRERELRDITSAAIHPLGIVFTLGHMDGSLSFWALDHDERPLSIHYLPSPTASPNAEREPIFKLAWSAFPSLEECKALLDQATSTQAEGVSLPRLAGSTLDYSGGETVLTLLGGLLLDEPAGARTLQIAPLHLPSLDPTKTEAETYIAELSTKFTIIGFDWIPASYPVDDFVLLPRSSPHYAGAFDPISILQSFKWGSGNSARSAVDALEFPPPLSATPMQQKAYNHGDPIKPLEIPLPQVNPNTLTQFRVPGIFSSGNDTVLGVQLRNIPKRPFARLLREWVEAGAAEDAEGALPSRRIPLRAGEARGAASSSTAQQYRILATFHPDLSIRFWDCSPLLMGSPTLLRFDFPQYLPHLRIDISVVIDDPIVTRILGAAASDPLIRNIHLSGDSLHCAIELSSGQILFYAFRDSSDRDISTLDDLAALDDEQNAVIGLADLVKFTKDGFYPVCLLDARCGATTSVAMSAYGVHAIAFDDGSLTILDVSGPRVLTPTEMGVTPKMLKDQKKRSRDQITILQWQDFPQDLSLRYLDVVRASGLAYVITLMQAADGGWSTSSTFERGLKTSVDGPSLLLRFDDPSATLSSSLARASLESRQASTSAPAAKFVLVCNEKEARCFLSSSNERVSKVEWKAPVDHVELVEKTGALALLAFTSGREIIAFSVPGLELMSRAPLPPGPDRLGKIHSDPSGDFVEFSAQPSAAYPFPLTFSTVFSSRRIQLPSVSLVERSPPLPLHPGPPELEGSYTAWIWGPKVYTGGQIDAILGGPDRRLPAQIEESEPASVAPQPSVAPPMRPQRSAQRRTSRPPIADSSTTGGIYGSAQDLYSRLQSAVTERGENLNELGDSVGELENASKSMMEQAKRVADRGNLARKFWF